MVDSTNHAKAVAAFDVLETRERIAVLHVLRRTEGPVDLRTLADRVAEGHSESRAKADGEADPATAIRLHHGHLPKLDEAGVLRYDRDARTVTEFDEDRLDALLDAARRVIASLQADVPVTE